MVVIYVLKVSNISRVRVESTLSRIREGHLSQALVINTLGAPITLKQGLYLCQYLVYDKQVICESEENPDAYVSAVGSQKKDSPNKQSSLDSYIKITHFTKMKPTLLQVLESHREAIVLPGDSLSGTHCAEHHIKLKPGKNTVYINAYKLPHREPL